MHNCRTPAQKSSKLCTHKRQSKKHDKDLQFAAKWYYLKLMPNSAVLLNFSPAGTVAKWACMSGTEPGVTSTSPYLLDLFVLGFVLNMQVRSRNHIQGCKTLRSLLNIMSKLQSFRNTKFSQILHRIMCVTSEAEYQAACLQLCFKGKPTSWIYGWTALCKTAVWIPTHVLAYYVADIHWIYIFVVQFGHYSGYLWGIVCFWVDDPKGAWRLRYLKGFS